eukprot:CAMPEP_0114488604 /NCGR_PEP_ID=MMETSP0109-20121206/1424_1 /TAXON_ID=29199 /ORGANISM="Chlorarachnion reptans, Strain CCCM449" /LENGTH=730 /DNA_ID=CAMNT_0001665019 /DNA_START=22 /DNA_END=2214 /DNA_ORIENTATION=+
MAERPFSDPPPAGAAGVANGAGGSAGTGKHTFSQYVLDLSGVQRATAESVGILRFRTRTRGFRALFKHRYADFVVQEVTKSGKVISNPTDEVVGEEKAPPPPTPDLAKAKQELEAAIGAEKAAALLAFVDECKTKKGDDNDSEANSSTANGSGTSNSKEIQDDRGNGGRGRQGKKNRKRKRGNGRSFIIPGLNDKEVRTKVHEVVRHHLVGFDSTAHVPSTKNEKGDQSTDKAIQVFEGRAQKKWGSRFKKTRPYLHFTLQKKNTDTMSCINSIAKVTRKKSKSFGYAGTKDKRAISFQRVSAFQIDHKKLQQATRTCLNRTVRIGSFEYKDTPLKLGDLKGNRFVVILRDVQPSESDDNFDCDAVIRNAAEALSANGFVNYYGLQRFGTGTIPTWMVGQAILCMDYCKAVSLILMPRSDDRKDVQEARETFKATGDIGRVLQMMPRYMHLEKSLLLALRDLGPKQALQALLRLPRGMRMMYVHSVQSLIWNRIASERLTMGTEEDAKYRDRALPGDLVYENEESSDGCPEKEDRQDDRSLPKVKVLSAETTSNYTVFDVVIPTPGIDVVIPPNLKEKYEKFQRELGVDFINTKRHNFPEAVLTGNYRKLLTKAQNLEVEVLRYRDEDECLADPDILFADLGGNRKSGSGKNRIENPAESKMADGAMDIQQGKGNVEGRGNVNEGRLEQSGEAQNPPERIAAKISFTLPSSSYATQAIRELVKTTVGRKE